MAVITDLLSFIIPVSVFLVLDHVANYSRHHLEDIFLKYCRHKQPTATDKWLLISSLEEPTFLPKNEDGVYYYENFIVENLSWKLLMSVTNHRFQINPLHY